MIRYCLLLSLAVSTTLMASEGNKLPAAEPYFTCPEQSDTFREDAFVMIMSRQSVASHGFLEFASLLSHIRYYLQIARIELPFFAPNQELRILFHAIRSPRDEKNRALIEEVLGGIHSLSPEMRVVCIPRKEEERNDDEYYGGMPAVM